MAEIFAVLMEHDSADNQVEVFTDRDDAILFARGWARENCWDEPECIKEMPVAGWEFCLRLGSDGDREVRVEAKPVDAKAAAVRRQREVEEAGQIARWTERLGELGYEVEEQRGLDKFFVKLKHSGGSIEWVARDRRQVWANLIGMMPAVTEAPK